MNDKIESAHVEIASLLNPPDNTVQNFLDLLLRVSVHQLAPSHLNRTFNMFSHSSHQSYSRSGLWFFFAYSNVELAAQIGSKKDFTF